MLVSCVRACVHARSLSGVSLRDLMDCCPPSSSVHGISQARILEWVVISFSRGSSWPRDEPASPASLALAGGFFTTKPPGKPHGIEARITIISGEKEGKKTTLLVCKALSEREKADKERGVEILTEGFLWAVGNHLWLLDQITEGVFGPRKENNSLKGPCWII